MKLNNKTILDYNYLDKQNNPFQVMMDWEKPYMEKCADILKPHGDVLEIGFGMGYSATAINKHRLRSYTVIEKDEDVIKNFKKWKKKQTTKKINLIKGMWQFKLPFTKKFDCIFFDDSPSNEIKLHQDRFNLFLKLILNHVKYNTVLVSYATAKSKLTGYLTKHFKMNTYPYRITIPYNCRYAKGNYMYVNKITFRKKL
tara:strand:- start:666 stop:1262 length:597 start_codon:yes stop_codon:yes gene_type:complete